MRSPLLFTTDKGKYTSLQNPPSVKKTPIDVSIVLTS